MWYLQLGWVGCWSIYFRDDSPFAYTFSRAGHYAWDCSLPGIFHIYCCFGVAWRGVAKGYLQCEEGSKHLQLDYIVHIHSVMITYSVSLDSICIAVGGRADRLLSHYVD